ncbi:alkaline phosphatase family protein [Acidobacteriota bacterium]
MASLTRRDFIKMGLTAGSLLAAGGSSDIMTRTYGKADTPKKMVILGLDGVDPHLLQAWMKAGRLPAFQKLQEQGFFTPLQTSCPPQSPVAWSNFITGMNPGGHGIFDFMSRNPEDYSPDFSSTLTEGAQKTITIGNVVLPLSGGKIEQKRYGRAFWQVMEDYDIPATIFKMPANYPPEETKQRTLSGMNTPDLTGNYGTYNYYTDDYTELQEASYAGGYHHEVYVIGSRVDARLPGPANTFRKGDPPPTATIDFKVYIDPKNPVAKIAIDGQEFILREKEWSGWKQIRYGLIPTQSVAGICRFYLKEIRPHFKLYVSPVNVDPADPAIPISTPPSYSRELADKFGSYFTKGLPADTHALDNHALDDKSFLELDDLVLEERQAMLEYEMSRLESGLLFYYVSSTDQRQHMFWRFLDKTHSQYDEKLAREFGDTIQNIYIKADRMLDRVMQAADKDTVIMVLSDHGFAPYRRSFNVNTWLKHSGYHSVLNERQKIDDGMFLNTDWTRTKAYAYGLNSIFLNITGREREGIVKAEEKTAVAREIAAAIEQYKDPQTGANPVNRAYVASDIYSGPHVDSAPDIVLGYNRGFRVSWSSPMGKITPNIMEDNREKWSGDHMSSPNLVPGILLMNQKLKRSDPALYDLAPTILKIFNIPTPENMIGKPIL